MKPIFFLSLYILLIFAEKHCLAKINYNTIINKQCNLKKYETNLGLFTIASCFSHNLRNEVYVFLNDKNIFFEEMKLDYNMPKTRDNFILLSGIIKGKKASLTCNRKNILIDLNKINPQYIEFGVEDLCTLLPEFGSRFSGVSIDTLDLDYNNNKLQLPETIDRGSMSEDPMWSYNLYSNIYREYLNHQQLNSLYFDLYKKYKVYIQHHKINLNDPEVKSTKYKEITYNKSAECDEKFYHTTHSGKVQLLACMKNEILIDNHRVLVADTPNDLKSKIYFSKKFSTFFGFSSVRQERKDNFIQYCGNELFFLDTSDKLPKLKAINFNINCLFIKDIIENEQELKIILSSNDEIIYKKNNIHFIQKSDFDKNDFYHIRSENIPYNVGEVTTFKNKQTTLTQINTYRDNRIFMNDKKIIGAQLLKIFDHDENKNIYFGGIYEYNYSTSHPSPCLKQLFFLDVTNTNNTQFYLFKNKFKTEFCIRDDIQIERIPKGLKFIINKYSSFTYTKNLTRLPYIPSIVFNLFNKRFLTVDKIQLPYHSPYNCKEEEYIENFKNENELTVQPRIEQNAPNSKIKNILYIDNRYYNKLENMDEEYLISQVEDYNYKNSFSYFRIKLFPAVLYYNHRKIMGGIRNRTGRGDIYRIAGNEKFMLGAAEVRQTVKREDNIVINYFFTDVTLPNPSLYILGLKETPDSISEVTTDNEAIIIKFIDNSQVKYDKGQFFITNNPQNKIYIEQKNVPYDIHSVETFAAPNGELKLHSFPDKSYLEFNDKNILISDSIDIKSSNKDNTIIIGDLKNLGENFSEICTSGLFLLDVSKNEPLLFTFENNKICSIFEKAIFNDNTTEIILESKGKLIYKNSFLKVISHYKIEENSYNEGNFYSMYYNKTNLEEFKILLNKIYTIKVKKHKIPFNTRKFN